MGVEKAVEQLKKGSMIVVYDGDEREGEADLIFCARFADPEKIQRLRRDAGGLICAAIGKNDAEKIGLPFFVELLEEKFGKLACRKTAYGDRPAFSLPINHCGVYTGITDNDRALTLRKLDGVLSRPESFFTEFYSPGHIFLLISSGLDKRKGHTELAVELGQRAGFGAMVLCEMLGDGNALPKEAAREYAERNGFAFIEGKEVFG